MYEKILERSEGNYYSMVQTMLCDLTFLVLDQLIEDFADLIQTHYSIPEFADPSSATDVCRVAAMLMSCYQQNNLPGRGHHHREVNSRF